jgi:hypothetical protein
MIIFLAAGVLAIAFGITLIVFRDPAARHAEKQMSQVVPSSSRPRYRPWFIAVIGTGMIVIGGYFTIASSVRLLG